MMHGQQNIKFETGSVAVHRIYVAEDIEQWWVTVIMIMQFRIL
jgi:hypothetical protein